MSDGGYRLRNPYACFFNSLNSYLHLWRRVVRVVPDVKGGLICARSKRDTKHRLETMLDPGMEARYPFQSQLLRCYCVLTVGSIDESVHQSF